MAIYKRDIASINLETGTIHRTFLNHSIGYKDQKADHFGIRVFRDGEPVDLTGVSVQGVFMPPQGDPIAITSGNIVSGNEAEVVLPQACYNYDGQFCLAIKLVDSNNSVTGTMRIVDGMVDNTHASGTVAPTSAVPTYQEILSTYDAMVAATAAANGAIAPLYANLTFPVKAGQYAIVDGALKRAIVDIATSEAYTAAHWTNAKLGPDVSDLKSALDFVASSDNDMTGNEVGTWISGKTISNTGVIISSGSYSCCADFIVIPQFATKFTVTAGHSHSIVIAYYSAPNESSYITRVFKDQDTITNIDLTTVKAIRIGVNSLSTSDASEISISWDYNLRHIFEKDSYRFSYPYGSQKLEFTVDGTTIKFSPGILLNHFKSADSKIKQEMINNENEEISVPHDNFAIYNFDTDAIEVKTYAYLRDNTNGNYVILFYNSNGYLKGNFEKYNLEQKLFTDSDLFFYGNDAVPTFAPGSDNSIIVTIPANARANLIKVNETQPTRKCGNVPGLAAQEITVPHDSCLVFNSLNNTLSVKNSTFNYDKYDTVLFYNSHGVPNGTWYRYFLYQKITEDVRYVELGYPQYFVSNLETKAKQINLQLAELQPVEPSTELTTQGSAFVFISDVHYNKNEMHSPGLVKAISNMTGITTIHVNGDQITLESDKQTALTKINQINGLYLYPGKETYFTVGNHEWNNPSTQTPEIQLEDYEMWYAFINPIRKRVVYDTKTVSYYYDDTDAQIRYLVGEVTRGSSVHGESAKWIASKIAEAPNGYGIVVIIHTILGYTKEDNVYTPYIKSSAGATVLIGAIDAVRAGTNYTYQGVTYEYANKNYEMIAAFCGDTHVDLFMRTPGGVPIICTTTDSKDELGGLDKTVGTINEQAFDVVVINRETKKINCNRIGRGSDRLSIDFVPQS